MKYRWILLVSLVILPLLVACGGDDEVDGPIFGFATYNAGLATGYVSYAPEREALIGDALAAVNADVICLEEVWTEDQAKSLIEGAKPSFEYSYYEMTLEEASEGEGEASCTDEEADPLETCVAANCADVAPENITACVLAQCGDEFGALSQECTNCVVANIGKSVDEILTICKSSEGSGQFAYEGHNGLLILSKHQLTNKDYKIFDSTLNRRVVLSADIALTDSVSASVFCTHLSANLSDVSYGGEYDSWGDEQAAQINDLLAYVTTQSSENMSVVMGDMNCGPETAQVSAELPENFSKFTDAGYLAPYAKSDTSPCSWCMENPLTGEDRADHIIDHVFFKNAPENSVATSARILDQEVTLTVEGEEIASRYSDHYGVLVQLQLDN